MSDYSKWEKAKASKNLKELSDIQYQVTQKEATERPFSNEFWDFNEDGIYVDIVSGEPLFSSKDKFDAGCGWPSFTKPIDEHFIISKKDFKLLIPRTEVRSRYADSHLGHVFPDGPPPSGLWYCIDLGCLRLVARVDMIKEGYEDYIDK